MSNGRRLFMSGIATGALSGAVYAQAKPVPKKAGPRLPFDVGTDDRIKTILQNALDDSLRAYVIDLFRGWMKDPKEQPQRASAGLHKAIAAYRHSVDALNKMYPDIR